MRTSAPVGKALQDLRHSLGATAALCDAILLGLPGDALHAQGKLPNALAVLSQRVQVAIETVQREGDRGYQDQRGRERRTNVTIP